jgi:hypothetical protein
MPKRSSYRVISISFKILNLMIMYINLRTKFHLLSCSVTLLIVTECVQLPPFFLSCIDMSREESDVSLVFKVQVLRGI